jgi:hypothetical protein
MKVLKNKWLLIFLVLIGIVYCLIEAQGEGDFYIFIWASGELSKHLNIYDHKYIDSYSYYYSVLFALILEPFYFISFYWVKFYWLILNLSLFFHLFYLLSISSLIHNLNSKQVKYFLTITFIFSFRFLHENIHYAQVTILMLWTCIYGIYCIYQSQSYKGCFILALGINIKLFPLVILPYLLYRGFFKEVLLVCLFYFGLMFFPSLIIGHDYNLTLIKSWWLLINPSNTNHILDVDERSFHGLSTLLSTLFIKDVPDVYAMPIKRNLFDISLSQFTLILLIVRLILMMLTLKFLKWPPFKKSKSRFEMFIELAYILLVIPLIFPHQQHYAFLFTVPAFAITVYFVILKFQEVSRVQRKVIVVLLCLSFLFCSSKVLLGVFNNYYEHFKILTYGALILIPCLIWVSQLNNRLQAVA